MRSERSSLNLIASRIGKRAEAMHPQSASKTFVRLNGFSDILEGPEHQVIFGRRGSGKTHALMYLAEIVREAGDIAIYVDLRQVGSSGGLYGDPRTPVAERGTQLLSDIVARVHDELLSLAIGAAGDDTGLEVLLPVLDRMIEAAASVQVIGDVERETTDKVQTSTSRSMETNLGVQSKLEANATVKRANVNAATVEGTDRQLVRGHERPHIVFGDLSNAWGALVADIQPRRVWLILDEWSSIPVDIQPLLADLIRRALLPLQNITVKIAAVERITKLELRHDDGDYLGIELGSDIPVALSVDEYLTSGNREDSEDFLSNLLHNHFTELIRELGYSDLKYPSGVALRSALFADDAAWIEYTYAAEGVPRDALNALSLASLKAGSNTISRTHIRVAARTNYLSYKTSRVQANEPIHRLLRDIINTVLGERKVRIFALNRDSDARDLRVVELYESRIIHPIVRGLPHEKDPGSLYDLYSIDYGCFVAHLTNDLVHLLRSTQTPSADSSSETRTVSAEVYRLPIERRSKSHAFR